MSETILVVAAHPDDEVLGCGGAVARHARSGDKVHVLILVEGLTARGAKRDRPAAQSLRAAGRAGRAGELKALERSARAAAKALGTAPPRLGRLPDNRLDTLALLDVVKLVESEVRHLEPAVVYTHHGGDLNIDHRIAHQAVVTACRPLPGASVRAIYGFETVSSTEWATPAFGPPFRPTRFVDIGAVLEKKLAALGCYGGEMRPWPHARSLESVRALALVRGASVGLEAAEAFEVIREIV